SWGKDGSAFPAADNRNRWTTGTGRIWDWSLLASDLGDPGPDATPATADDLPVALDIRALPTGDDTLEHKWTGTAADQAACTAAFPGSVYIATNDCRTTHLINAVEIAGDVDGDGNMIGNDNSLCESGEDCLFTPNMASYQGHGTLVSAGAFTDGTITGVVLWRYDTNGY
ncbi:MAG: hypothetical protein OEZ59_06745, partial [Deltaproteobacteria bacterium]|nr:hypothetical protein [Deltaproteobacteria bacterium]